MDKKIITLEQEDLETLVDNGMRQEIAEEFAREIELLAMDGGILDNERMRERLIYYIDSSYGKKDNKQIIFGEVSIGLLEKTIINKYLKKSKNKEKAFSKERKDIPEDLMFLFLHAAKYYRMNGDIEKAKQIFAKIKDADRYKNVIGAAEMLQEEDAACDLSELDEKDMTTFNPEGKTMKDLIDFLRSNGIEIELSNDEIFSMQEFSGDIERNGSAGENSGKKYPETLSAFSRLKFFCNNFPLNSVTIVKEGGFRGATILSIKDSNLSFIESFFEKLSEESYGKATYIVANDLIGSSKLKEESRKGFRKKNGKDVEAVAHRTNYYTNIERKYEEMLKTIERNKTNIMGNDPYEEFEQLNQTMKQIEEEIVNIQRQIAEKQAAKENSEKIAKEKREIERRAREEAERAEKSIQDNEKFIENKSHSLVELRKKLENMSKENPGD